MYNFLCHICSENELQIEVHTAHFLALALSFLSLCNQFLEHLINKINQLIKVNK